MHFWQGLLIIGFSFIPAWLSYHFIENPMRNWSAIKADARKAVAFGVILMTVSATAGILLFLSPNRSQAAPPQFSLTPYDPTAVNKESEKEAAKNLFGAEALTVDPDAGEVVDRVDNFYPTTAKAKRDYPSNYAAGCHQEVNETSPESCVYGDKNSDFSVALVGDSHAGHWLPALEPIAEAQGWRLEVYTKSQCPLISTAIKLGETFYAECYEWNEKLLAKLTGPSAPNHVIVSSQRYASANPLIDSVATGTVSEGYEMAWNSLKDAGVSISVLLDTPRPQIDIPECVASNRDNLSECSVHRSVALGTEAHPQQKTAAQNIDVPVLDLSNWICPEEYCSAVIGNVLVYRDSHHLTATYARSLSSALWNELVASNGEPFK